MPLLFIKPLGINALALSDRHPTYHETPPDQVKMDDLNITIEEYIRLEEEKAHRCGKVYNWETATYGKIWYDEDVHDLRSVETGFPTIVLNDALTFEVTLLCKPTPTVNYFDDLDYFNDFEKEFPAIVYRDNVVGALMNVPIFVGTFSIVTDFVVLEDMDAYRNERMGDVIVGEPFLREVGINARRFDEMITIYNGDDEVSEHDKMNGISHSYQKLKRFYKGVLNLGPDFIRVPSMEECLTRGHVSVHVMEW
ncbi:hypothetical protein Tco_0830403 [Tanacetum coccineum]